MAFLKKNGIRLLSILCIPVAFCFSLLALRRYGMLTEYWYIALLPIMLMIPFCLWLLRAERKAHIAFGVVFFVSGLLYMISVPMLQVSDEPQHFLRSYEIASVQTPQSRGTDDVGDYMPANLIPPQYSDPAVTSYRQVLDSFGEHIDSERSEWYSFPGSALYSPFTYIPQSLGIFIADLFTDNSAVILYAGRLMTLIAVTLLAMLSIKLFPFAKALPFLLMTVTIYVQKAGSMSADGMTLAVVMLFISYVLHLQYGTVGRLRSAQILPLYILVFMLSQCKIVYLPVCLFFFVISPERFGSRKRYCLNLIGLIVLALAAGLGWLAIASAYLSVGYSTSSVQIHAVLSDPIGYIQVLARTFRESGRVLLEQMMGIGLGVGGVRNSRLLTYAYLAAILFASVFVSRGEFCPDQKRDKWLAFLSALGVALLTCTALYVQWTAPGSETIMGLQGRYFLPVLFLVCTGILQIKPLDRLRLNIGHELPAMLSFCVNLTAVVSCFAYGLTL